MEAPATLLHSFDTTALISVVESWARKANHYSTLFDLYEHSGGWEGWLQAELALNLETFTKSSNTTVAPLVDREVHVYNVDPSSKADLVFYLYTEVCGRVQRDIRLYHDYWKIYEDSRNAAYKEYWKEIGTLPRKSFIMELKCESHNNRIKFKSGVLEDLKKIRRSIKLPGSPIHEEPIVLVMAISISDEGWREMLDIKKDPSLRTKVVVLGQDSRYNAVLWVFGWKTDWVPSDDSKTIMWNGHLSIES